MFFCFFPNDDITEPLGPDSTVKTQIPSCKSQGPNDVHLRSTAAASFANYNATNVKLNGVASKRTIRNSHPDQVMEFLMPQAPALRQSQPSMARKNGGVYLIGTTADMKENYHQLQAQHKMTKKQLKLAQAQLDKLSQINIHLHGMFFFSVVICNKLRLVYISFTSLSRLIIHWSQMIDCYWKIVSGQCSCRVKSNNV